MPLRQITLQVTFGTPSNFRTEFIKFEVASFDSSYNAIFGCPTLAKFTVVPHYPYLLLTMVGPNGVLLFRCDLKHFYDSDIEPVQIAARAQLALEGQEIAKLAHQTKPEDMEILTKKPGVILTVEDEPTKKIALDANDASKMAVISTQLSEK